MRFLILTNKPAFGFPRGQPSDGLVPLNCRLCVWIMISLEHHNFCLKTLKKLAKTKSPWPQSCRCNSGKTAGAQLGSGDWQRGQWVGSLSDLSGVSHQCESWHWARKPTHHCCFPQPSPCTATPWPQLEQGRSC